MNYIKKLNIIIICLLTTNTFAYQIKDLIGISDNSYLLIAVPEESNLQQLTNKTLGDFGKYFKQLSINDLREFVKNEGFRIIHSEIHREMLVYHSFEEVHEAALGFIPENIQEDFFPLFQDRFTEYAHEYQYDDGLIYIPSKTLILILIESF